MDPTLPPGVGQQRERYAQTPRGTRAENLALRQKELFATARGVALTFFDTYLRADAAGREALQKANDRKGVTVEMK